VDAVIAQGAEGGGHTGPCRRRCSPPRWSTPWRQGGVLSAGGYFNAGSGGRPRLRASASPWHTLPLTTDSKVPDEVKAATCHARHRDGRDHQGGRGAPTGHPHELVDHLERQSWLRNLPRALRSAHDFRRDTGSTLADLLREGRAMKQGNELDWTDVVMAANARS